MAENESDVRAERRYLKARYLLRGDVICDWLFTGFRYLLCEGIRDPKHKAKISVVQMVLYPYWFAHGAWSFLFLWYGFRKKKPWAARVYLINVVIMSAVIEVLVLTEWIMILTGGVRRFSPVSWGGIRSIIYDSNSNFDGMDYFLREYGPPAMVFVLDTTIFFVLPVWTYYMTEHLIFYETQLEEKLERDEERQSSS